MKNLRRVLRGLVWTSISAAGLAFASVVLAFQGGYTDLVISFGLAAVAVAMLATREK
jgi:hypothetical protein